METGVDDRRVQFYLVDLCSRRAGSCPGTQNPPGLDSASSWERERLIGLTKVILAVFDPVIESLS